MLNRHERKALLNLGKDSAKTITLLDGVVIQGAGTAVDVPMYEKFQAQVSGITTATVKVEGSVDGTNFFDISGGGKTADALYTLIQGMYAKIRGNVTAYTSGTITLKVIAKK